MRTIIVNGRTRQWGNKTISFMEVVLLAFQFYNKEKNVGLTVTYKIGSSNGIMIENDVVSVKNKMVFNVSATNRA